MKQISWVALGWIMLTFTAQAASFDCSKANTPQEKLICFDYRLSDLDSQLAWSYTEALKQTKNPSPLKESQKAWVATRGKCTNVNCAIHAYVERIEELMPGANLNEVYFPKAKIPWDFSPKSGYRVSGYPHLKENKLAFSTFPRGTILHGEDLIIPADDHNSATTNSGRGATSRLQDLVTSLVDSKFKLISGEPIELGDMYLAVVASSYGECEGGLGMSGTYVARDVPWTKNNILVQLRSHGWTAWKFPGDADFCYEAQLKIDPTMMGAIIFNQSLYLYETHSEEGHFVIRLDRNLQTASPLLGKEIYLGWGSDLEALTRKTCDKFVEHAPKETDFYSTKHRICIDGQLQKLVDEVGHFYN